MPSSLSPSHCSMFQVVLLLCVSSARPRELFVLSLQWQTLILTTWWCTTTHKFFYGEVSNNCFFKHPCKFQMDQDHQHMVVKLAQVHWTGCALLTFTMSDVIVSRAAKTFTTSCLDSKQSKRLICSFSCGHKSKHVNMFRVISISYEAVIFYLLNK